MTKIKWRDVFKFLSGAALAASFTNLLWFLGMSVPFFGYTITPGLLGLRAAVQFVLFVVFLYFGWMRVSSLHRPTARDDPQAKEAEGDKR